MLSNYGHASYYICGDFNINLLKIGMKSHYNTLFENMLSSGFYPKITLPTRICNTSSTIINNIFSKEICSNDASGISLTIYQITKQFLLETPQNLITLWNNNMCWLDSIV